MQVSLQCREGGKTYPSRRLKRATSAINRVFLSATPFDHTQLCHVLPQPCMLRLSIGKGRQLTELCIQIILLLVYIVYTSYSSSVCARGSSSFYFNWMVRVCKAKKIQISNFHFFHCQPYHIHDLDADRRRHQFMNLTTLTYDTFEHARLRQHMA